MKHATSSRQGLVQLRCRCGEPLRVAEALDRKAARCSACDEEDDRALLRSFGIDPDAARAAWAAERLRRLRCARCDRRLADDERPVRADVRDDEVVCGACRAAAVEARGARPASARGKVAAAAPREIEADLRRRTWAYGALFFLGVGGFMSTIVGAGPVSALAVAALAAVGGGRATREAYAAGAARAG